MVQVVKVDVDITVLKVRYALHMPGGVVHDWHQNVGRSVTAIAKARSPVNNVLNQLHRERWGRGAYYPPGTFKRSWEWHTTTGSNQHQSRLAIRNTAPHARYVEEGRRASYKYQAFTWTKGGLFKGKAHKRPGWKYYLVTAGGKNSALRKTNGRPGKHILRDATRDRLALYGIAVF